MSRVQKRATETGLKISDRFSDATIKYIEEWDPDLHYEIMKVRKKRRRKK
ncbi:MAG: hypothetical protein ACW99G_21605 [Candidatus Thorarchaeota archaeon]|jgi:hypothetical protein